MSTQILVVEDDEGVRESLKDALEDEGFEVFVATDHVLPQRSGSAFVADLRRLEAGRGTRLPVVAVSGSALEREALGDVDDVLRKPFDVDGLLTVIRRLIG
jgi:CheY-like chemotaxis protein